MKNMLKNKTSLIIVCVFIGILICYFTICNCQTNYSLIEGMATMSPPGSGPGSTSPLKGAIAKAASMGVKPDGPAPSASISNTTAVGAKPKPSATPVTSASPVTPTPAPTATPVAKKEGFQQQRPIEFASLQESKSDDWNLSKWVKDAMRYAKGMGNENRLDSYQYNSGPQIPLPEGEMFFFKDTKFSPNCCPSTYSSSLGCSCLSINQVNHLVRCGGNNTVPPGLKTAYYNEY